MPYIEVPRNLKANMFSTAKHLFALLNGLYPHSKELLGQVPLRMFTIPSLDV